jgi:hypothetical protein
MKVLHWPRQMLQLLRVESHVYQIPYEVPQAALKSHPERNR